MTAPSTTETGQIAEVVTRNLINGTATIAKHVGFAVLAKKGVDFAHRNDEQPEGRVQQALQVLSPKTPLQTLGAYLTQVAGAEQLLSLDPIGMQNSIDQAAKIAQDTCQPIVETALVKPILSVIQDQGYNIVQTAKAAAPAVVDTSLVDNLYLYDERGFGSRTYDWACSFFSTPTPAPVVQVAPVATPETSSVIQYAEQYGPKAGQFIANGIDTIAHYTGTSPAVVAGALAVASYLAFNALYSRFTNNINVTATATADASANANGNKLIVNLYNNHKDANKASSDVQQLVIDTSNRQGRSAPSMAA